MRCISESSQIYNTWAEANALDMMIQEAGQWVSLRGYDPHRHRHVGDADGPLGGAAPRPLHKLHSADVPETRSEFSTETTETETAESGSTSGVSQCSTTLIASMSPKERSGGARVKARCHDNRFKPQARLAQNVPMRARKPAAPKVRGLMVLAQAGRHSEQGQDS